MRGLAGLPFALLAGCSSRGERRKQPDIVLLIADSLRADSLPFHGYTRDTAPFLKKLATRSIVFDRCVSSATWTRPAITGILSGLTPIEHRQWEFQKSYPSDLPSFPLSLRRAGYRTGYFTASHAVGEGYGMEHHFDHVSVDCASQSIFDDRLTDRCLDWVRGSTDDQPIFASVHFFPPHGPYDPPEHLLRQIGARPDSDLFFEEWPAEVEISLGNGCSGRIPWYQAIRNFDRDPVSYLDGYDAYVRYADSLLEDFLARWTDVRGDRQTVFFITADHGECLGEHEKWFDHARILSNQILHVPLLVHNTREPHQQRVRETVSHLDLAPTICRLAGTDHSVVGFGTDILTSAIPRSRTIISQVAMEGHEFGWALTVGPWRHVYNDCPRDGLAPIRSVEADGGERWQWRNRRLVTPPKHSSLRHSKALAPGVWLESCGFDQPFLDTRPLELRGRIESSSPGQLELRWAQDGRDSQKTVAHRLRSPGEERFRCPLFTSRSNSFPDPGRFRVETRWVDSKGAESPWRHLFTSQRLRGMTFHRGVKLQALEVLPLVSWPGEAIRVAFVWEITDVPSQFLGLETRLLDQDGKRVFSRRRPFAYGEVDDISRLKPLIEKWRLRGYSFTDRIFRFDEAEWFELPGRLDPGNYRFEVVPLDLRTGQAEKKSLRWERPGSRLAIVRGPGEALSWAEDNDPEIEGIPGPCFELAAEPSAKLTAHLRQRYPEEGHFHVWHSEVPTEEELASCLLSTPRHRAAVNSSPRNEKGTELAFQFGPLIRLLQVHAKSIEGDARIHLTLTWECLGRTSTSLAGELSCQAEESTGSPESLRSGVWWFLGGTKRPAQEWKIGEIVREVVEVPVPPGSTILRLKLAVSERWAEVYSNSRLKPLLPVYGSKGPVGLQADLGLFSLGSMPGESSAQVRTTRRKDPDQSRLYDLSRDPFERNDLSEQRPDVLDNLTSDLAKLVPLLEARTANLDATAKEQEMSEEAERQLRSLGYLTS